MKITGLTVISAALIFGALAGASDAKSPDSAAGQAQKAFEPAAAKSRSVRPQAGQTNVPNPADALNRKKVGLAARFIRIPAGEFQMGSPANEEGRGPNETRHPVRLSADFEMQATEVTQIQYFLATGKNPSGFRQRNDCDSGGFRALYGVALCAHQPVETVSWDEAQEFINALNNSQSRYTYRLPTEAEWEYAARAQRPAHFPYSFGFNETDLLDRHAWHEYNAGGRTHSVISKRANPFRLYGMHGHVWEWTQDFYDANYGLTDFEAVAADPTGPAAGRTRVIRGGAWNTPAGSLRSAGRLESEPGYKGNDTGFRLVRAPR
ncbi:MAG: formylglycine-generating enzyme family protein [Elusimicrobia bacterium]|nr:formylglycine-generating enzyme family protein [Elusimicrobiota bacterium]